MGHQCCKHMGGFGEFGENSVGYYSLA